MAAADWRIPREVRGTWAHRKRVVRLVRSVTVRNGWRGSHERQGGRVWVLRRLRGLRRLHAGVDFACPEGQQFRVLSRTKKVLVWVPGVTGTRTSCGAAGQ